MKKCEYCAKEISYHEQYCSDDCHINANKYYEKSEKFARPFYILSTICVIGIPIGLFLFSFIKVPGAFIASACSAILGVMILIAPMPTEGMIRKNKIKKAVKKTRILGIAMLVLAVLILGLLLIFGF
jgi:predicted nucleic acid-binding Zn ribbon protein